MLTETQGLNIAIAIIGKWRKSIKSEDLTSRQAFERLKQVVAEHPRHAELPTPDWNIGDYVKEVTEHIRKQRAQAKLDADNIKKLYIEVEGAALRAYLPNIRLAEKMADEALKAHERSAELLAYRDRPGRRRPVDRKPPAGLKPASPLPP